MDSQKRPVGRPKTSNSLAEQEMKKAEESLDAFEKTVEELTLDRMNMAPKEEKEQQTKLSSREIDKADQIYLKPKRTISSREKFNEKYRDKYNFAKELVCFIAENKEVIGESIEMWTKPFAGVPAEEWVVPVNTPVWGPRYLAEQIKKASYHRLRTEDSIQLGSDGRGTYHGAMVVDQVVQRLDAYPASTRKSVFMGASF